MFENLKKKQYRTIPPPRTSSPEVKKRFLSYPVVRTLEDMGCNPFEIMASLAMNSTKERIRLDAATELAKYISPQLKSVEFKGEIPSQFKLVLNMSGNNEAPPESGETYEHGA